MASIAKLVVTLAANTGAFDTDMNRTAAQQRKRMRDMEKTAAMAGKAMAAAFTATAGAMTAMVVKTTKTADATAKMAGRLGTSTEALSQLGHVADLSGVSFNQLTIGMQRMERRIAEVAALGKGEAKAALEELGLSAKKLAEMPVDKQFEAVAEELSKVKNQSDKVRLAFKLFDSEGVALIQTMDNGAQGIRDMREEADRLGLTIGGDLAANSELFNDNIKRLEAGLTGASNQMVTGMLPALIGVQEYFLGSAVSADTFRTAGENLGGVIQYLTRSFTVLWGMLQTVSAALIGIVQIVVNAVDAMIAPIRASIIGLAQAGRALADGDFKTAWESLANIASTTGDDYKDALAGMQRGLEEVRGSTVYYNDAVKKSQTITKVAAKDTKAMGDAAEDAAKGLDKNAKSAKELEKEYKDMADKTDAAFESLEYLVDELEDYEQGVKDAADETADFADKLSDLVNELFPGRAAAQEFDDKIELLTQGFLRGNLSMGDYSRLLQKLTTDFYKAQTGADGTKDSFDALTTALDEGVRIMERAFQSVWEGIIDGSEDAFSGILDGFKSLLAKMAHQATTGKITLAIQDGLSGKGWDFQGIISSAVATGIVLGAGALGDKAGQYAAQFAAIGSLFGPWGTAIGAVVGALGGLYADTGKSFTELGDKLKKFGLDFFGNFWGRVLDKIFGVKKYEATFGGGNTQLGTGGEFFNTDLGGAYLFASNDLKADELNELVAGITEFDAYLAQWMSDDQLNEVGDLLSNWAVELTGSGLSLQEFLRSRLSQIEYALGGPGEEGILAWIRKAETLDDQMQRLAVAFSTETLFKENPGGIFDGHTKDEFLELVEAFQNGTEDIAEAFQQVVEMLDLVSGLQDFLSGYSGSDLTADFEFLMDRASETVGQTLTRLGMELFDMIAVFDGSPEQLQAIGEQVNAVRQGELQLLQQIDSIQKGINSNLEKLREDLLGVIDGPKDRFALIGEAESAVGALATATSAEEIAAIAQQFEAAIRAMTPEDQAKFGRELIELVDLFQTRSDAQLELLRANAVTAADSNRAMVDEFLARIGDPIDFITEYNARQADALDVIAETAVTKDDLAEQAEMDRQEMADVMGTGLDNMTGAVANIGPTVANAVRAGFSGVQIVVQQPGSGLVTQ